VAKKPSNKKRGFTLMTALAFSLIVGTVLAGVGTLASSHYSRSNKDGSYADAVALADAGVNSELVNISKNLLSLGNVHQLANKGTVNTSTGSFTVFVRPYGTACNGTDNTWAPPQDVCIISTGTVNGISRTVEARGTRKSVFDEYAIYSYKIAVFNGTGASGKDGVEGNMGTNGPVTFHGSEGTDAINGTLSLNGSGASSNDTGANVNQNPDAVFFPTVSQVAQTMFPGGGLTWLQTHNANASIMMLRSADPTLATEPTIAGFTAADVATKLTTAGFTSGSRSLGSAPLAVTTDTSTLDAANTGTRFMMPADPTFLATSIGAKGTPVYFLPPGDYYFSDLSFLNKGSWIMLTHLCDAAHPAIRIWVDSNSTSDDNISKLNVIFTDPSATKFRLYYNKCATLTMHGQAVFRGSIYGIKNGCTNGPGVDLAGGNEIYGSVIANTFTIGGGSYVVFPNNGGNDSTDDSALWYGFKDKWKEDSWNGSGTVFTDGTQN